MQERPHEDVGVQRQASLFFYGEGGSGETASTEDKLVRELSFDVTRRFAVAEGSVDACTTRGVDRAAAFAW